MYKKMFCFVLGTRVSFYMLFNFKVKKIRKNEAYVNNQFFSSKLSKTISNN